MLVDLSVRRDVMAMLIRDKLILQEKPKGPIYHKHEGGNHHIQNPNPRR